MQSQSDQRTAVAELAQKLLSRDPVEFNSTINQTFAARAQYTGHGLNISGTSNLKHVAWLASLIDSGPIAVIEDVKWNDESSTAHVIAHRFIRPRFFPLFSLAFKVNTKLQFHAEGTATPTPGKVSSRQANKADQVLYVTSVQDDWVAESLAHRFSFVSLFLQYLITPILTWFVLLLSNLTFDVHARVASSHRHHLEPSVRRLASDHLPSDVSRNLGSGFQQGRKLAKGSGARLFDLIDTVAYFPLSAVEALSQAGFQLAGAISPVPLPTPFVYYGHVEEGFHAMKINSASQRVEQMNRSLHPKPTQDTNEAEPAQKKSKTQSNGASANGDSEAKSAQIEVGSNIKAAGSTGALDGGVPQAKTVDISSRINNEAEEKPAAKDSGEDKHKEPLYDQLRRDGIVGPGAPPMHHADSEESTSDEGAQNGTDAHSQSKSGSAKKNKKRSKKSKAAAKSEDHAPPPTFMQGLEDAQGAK